VADGSPTVRRRELGTLLRKLREEKGMSVKQVTEHLLCSPSKVSRIETGQRGATLRDVRDLCDFYGVTDQAFRDQLMDLAKQGKQQGWWQPFDLTYSSYVGFEAEALVIRDFDSAVVPGLLQTPDYVRALHDDPLPFGSPDLVEQRIQVRLKRQELLTREGPAPLELHAVLDEAVLHRAIGGRAVMAAQLRRVVGEMERPNVTVQIIPYSVGAHPALDSNFRILEFAGAAPDLVYSEGLVGFIYLDRAEDIARYHDVFQHLSQIALKPDQSAELMLEISQAYESPVRTAS
jgi:transcriptional regulator with XRE-family HTH domain